MMNSLEAMKGFVEDSPQEMSKMIGSLANLKDSLGGIQTENAAELVSFPQFQAGHN